MEAKIASGAGVLLPRTLGEAFVEARLSVVREIAARSTVRAAGGRDPAGWAPRPARAESPVVVRPLWSPGKEDTPRDAGTDTATKSTSPRHHHRNHPCLAANRNKPAGLLVPRLRRESIDVSTVAATWWAIKSHFKVE